MMLKRDHDLRLYLDMITLDTISHKYCKTSPCFGLRLVHNFQEYRKEPCHQHCLATAPASYLVSHLPPIIW